MTEVTYSVTVPVYNESENVQDLVQKIESVMNSIAKPWELILVDGGSSDDSFAKMKEIQTQCREGKSIEKYCEAIPKKTRI